MVRPVFADPKTDFVFQRIFGSEDHKPVLIGFLNDLLELALDHRLPRLRAGCWKPRPDAIATTGAAKRSDLNHSV
jgi:hypothetical protein